LAGVHRARHLAKHLPAAGWRPIVLCVDERFHEEKLDYDLASLVPTSTEIVKTDAIPVHVARPIGIGDLGLRAGLQIRRALFGLLRKRQIATVLITGAPYYPMLLASAVKKRFGVPVVLDFQDPWVSAQGFTRPKMSKAGLSHGIATALEPRVVRAADFVTSVSENQNAEMAKRYPWIASRTAAIPIGGDPDDFLSLRAGPSTTATSYIQHGCVNLSFVGTFMPRSGEPFRALFRAFRHLRTSEPALAATIRLNFIGTSNQPNDSTGKYVRPLAEAEGVSDAVYEIPQRIPYLDALRVLAQSDGLLLVGSDEPHYTASKIYPGLMSGRPFLSLFHAASSAHAILSAAGGGRAFAFADPAELAQLELPMAMALKKLATQPHAFGAVNRDVYEPYEARSIAGRFGAIFDRIASGCLS
jgi:hypothetical protein